MTTIVISQNEGMNLGPAKHFISFKRKKCLQKTMNHHNIFLFILVYWRTMPTSVFKNVSTFPSYYNAYHTLTLGLYCLSSSEKPVCLSPSKSQDKSPVFLNHKSAMPHQSLKSLPSSISILFLLLSFCSYTCIPCYIPRNT